MLQRTRLVASAITVSAVMLLGAHPSHAERPDAGVHERVTTASAAVPPVEPIVEASSYLRDVIVTGAAYAGAVEQGHVVDYVNAVTAAHVADYVNAVAAAQVPSTSTSSAPSGGYSGGGACGGASNGADQYIHRESGGDPTIANGGGHAASPFDAGRAWGCYQILPSTWASSCSDITTYDPASQARCASRLPDSAWAL